MANDSRDVQASALVVEDDPGMASMIQDALESAGLTATIAGSVFIAEGFLRKGRPDVVILDRGLPDKDGLELCRALRKDPACADVPILFLTAKATMLERVKGLDSGADDYLAKPFHPRELIARIEALLRRALRAEEPREAVQVGDLRVDMSSRKASRRGRELDLRPREFDLLAAFLSRPGRVLTRVFLLESVWRLEENQDMNHKTVDVTVGNLREKLGPDGRKFVSIKGLGYRFDP